MKLPQRRFFELCERFAALHDGNLEDAEVQALEELLGTDSEARRLYVRYMRLCAGLAWDIHGSEPEEDAVQDLVAELAKAARHGEATNTSRPTQFRWPFKSLLATLVGLAAVVLLVIGLTRWFPREGVHPANGAVAHHDSSLPPKDDRRDGASVLVAQVIRTSGCRWTDEDLFQGDRLAIGRNLHLASGVAEIRFDVGVKVVLQAPAGLVIESAKSARLDRGKLTAAILAPAARGFRIDTPEATYIDQGTEFGVEVTAGGSSRACVFKGRIDVATKGRESAFKPLAAEQGVRVEDDGQEVTFIEDSGDSFIQTVEQAESDNHVLAWWRFEDQPTGTVLPHTGRNKNPVRATSDSSFNGNDLFVWSPDSRPVFSTDVAADTLPRTGAGNRSCLDLTDPLHRNKTRSEVYTNSRFSHASPRDIQQVKPARWTVEASVKIKKLEQTRQTIVCRDGSVGKSARFNLAVNPDGHVVVTFYDVKSRYWNAVSEDPVIKEGHWYHVAAASDGRTLQLYVDCGDGKGYQLVASTELASSGSTALGSSGDDCAWAVGRSRLKKGAVGDGLLGWIDEVRICDEALGPAEFLFAKKKPDPQATAKN